MRNLKITEKQAELLKNINSKRVLKITPEQYSRISELNQFNGDVIGEMNIGGKEITKTEIPSNKVSSNFRKEFGNTIGRIYENFISELYGLTESKNEIYEKLFNLMEATGLLKDRKLVKTKFGTSENAKKAICAGLSKLEEGASCYSVVETIENALKYDEISGDYFNKQLQKKKTTIKTKDELEKSISDIRKRELQLRKDTNQELSEDNGDVYFGDKILTNKLLDNLPNTRAEVDWGNRLNFYIESSDDADALIQIFSKDDLVNYVFNFIKKFKTKPKFTIERDFDRNIIKPLNDVFKEWKYSSNKIKSSSFKPEDTLDEVDETTTTSSSGQFTGLSSDTPRKHYSNVGEELINDELEIPDYEIEVNKLNKEIISDTIRELITLIPSPTIYPTKIIDLSPKIKDVLKHVTILDDTEIPNKIKFIDKSFGYLVNLANKSIKGDEKSFERYIEVLSNIFTVLKLSKKEFIGETTTVSSVGGDSGTFAYDAPAGDGAAFWTTGNKENKKIDENINESGEVRYVVSVDFFVWANDDQNAISEAEAIINEIDLKYDNSPKITSLVKQEFGTIGNVKVVEDLSKPQYPDGKFVEFDDCVKLDNNKTAQDGGCSTGAIDNVVKLKNTN
jgi:DNA-directed RNA polymerase subunit F